jgi:D-alanyl-D-alanine carboxypeptidase
MLRQAARRGFLVVIFAMLGAAANAAPYAAMVMDARTGEILLSRNADTRLNPASLTKMMTLYIAFEALKTGEIKLDQKVTISRKAAAEPPSKLGLRAGQRIAIRYLIRAAAVKSANDAATALGEAISGSEAAFARRMNKTAKALGMSRSTFKNAHGLTEPGHLSTARDMTTLGRYLLYDYPQYYNLFSRQKTRTAGKEVRNTNRKFLSAYKGADGIKTGYTSAAGFNLVASAERGNERIIATVFGGRSVAMRNQKAAELLDLGFRRAPSRVTFRPPPPPNYQKPKTIRVAAAVRKSPRPQPRSASAGLDEKAKTAISEAVAAAISDQQNKSQPEGNVVAQARPAPRDDGLRVVTRVSTSGAEAWGIALGAFSSRTKAEKLLLKTALQDLSSLDGALRKVVPRSGKYQAQFVGLSESMAKRACSRLSARRQICTAVGPGG